MSFIIWLYLDATLALLHNNALGCQPINLFARGVTGMVIAMRCPGEAAEKVIHYGDYMPLAVTRAFFESVRCQ